MIFKLTLVNGGWGISYEIALRWMPLDLTDDKQSGTKPNLVAKIWLPTLVTICNGLPKLVDKISSHIDHLVNTGLDVGSLVKWLPIKVATPANQTQFEWFIARRL